MWFTHIFHWFCSILNPLVKKVINSRYDIIVGTFQPMNLSAKPCVSIYIDMCVSMCVYVHVCVCVCVCVCIYIYIYHHHQVVLVAWISLTLSCHISLSSITSGRLSRLHPVSIQSCCRKVLVGRPTSARLCEGVHRRTFNDNYDSQYIYIYIYICVCVCVCVWVHLNIWLKRTLKEECTNFLKRFSAFQRYLYLFSRIIHFV